QLGSPSYRGTLRRDRQGLAQAVAKLPPAVLARELGGFGLEKRPNDPTPAALDATLERFHDDRANSPFARRRSVSRRPPVRLPSASAFLGAFAGHRPFQAVGQPDTHRWSRLVDHLLCHGASAGQISLLR